MLTTVMSAAAQPHAGDFDHGYAHGERGGHGTLGAVQTDKDDRVWNFHSWPASSFSSLALYLLIQFTCMVTLSIATLAWLLLFLFWVGGLAKVGSWKAVEMGSFLVMLMAAFWCWGAAWETNVLL